MKSGVPFLLLSLSILFLSGCARAAADEPAVPGYAAAGELRLQPCNIDLDSAVVEAECGDLFVPENRSSRGSRLISLPVVRIPAAGNAPGEPIFFLAGGPGASNMQGYPTPALLDRHDWVMVGYRGVDGSVVLDCPEVSTAIRGDGTDVLGEASLTGMAAAMKACAGRLASEDVDLDGYTIQEVVEDMDSARAALGYERVNLFSVSYGTRVAQIYAAMYPDRVFRSALIAVNPPGHFVWEPDVVDRQMAYYSDLYAETSAPRVPDLAETIRQVAADMPDRWLFFRIDPGKVRSTAFAMLFHRGSAAMVFDAFLDAAEGDPSGLALMSLSYDFVIPNMSVWGEFFSKAVSADYQPDRDYTAEMDPPESVIGSPLSKLFWGSANVAGEDAWPMDLMPAELRQVQTSSTETLMVSGSVDFSTPAEAATDELLPALPNGQQVILAEMGHVDDLMRQQPEAMEHLLTTFYHTGTVDDSQFVYQPMDFEVGMGFPQLAKLIVGAVAVVILLLSAGVGWFLKRRARNARHVKG